MGGNPTIAPAAVQFARDASPLPKRLSYDDCDRLSSRYDGGEERDAMLQGITKLQRALAEAGFAPR
jgi:hypothetical protein